MRLEEMHQATGTTEWLTSPQPLDYEAAVAFMETRVAEIAAGHAPELVWLLEHPPLYTAGTSARPEDLITPDRFPVYKTGRGGQFTYHGPGQRVAYVMLNLRARKPDVRAYVTDLETWLIRTLEAFDLVGRSYRDRIGIWVGDKNAGASGESKIAAVGVRLRKWVSYHGISLNVAPDLGHFDGIVPCGIRDHGVTSLAALGIDATMADVDTALKQSFQETFGPVQEIPAQKISEPAPAALQD